MSQSPLVTKWWPAYSGNYTAGRSGSGIFGIIIHHAASTSLDSVGTVFSTPGRMGSAHYGVKGNQIHQYVAEENAAWHCGDYWGNMGSIGIETVNSTGAPNWLIDEETFETLVRLVADIAKRNNLGVLKFDPNGVNPVLSAHRDWSATACPGDFLYSRMDELATKANAINYPPAPTEPPKPAIVWQQLDEPLQLFTNVSARLIDLDTGEVKQTYAAMTKIRLTQQTNYGGKIWYRTQYSAEKGFNWAFESDMFIFPEEQPTQPDPSAPSNSPNSSIDGVSPHTPSDPVPSQGGQDKNDEKNDGSQDGSSPSKKSILAIIIDFLKKIIKLLTTKKG